MTRPIQVKDATLLCPHLVRQWLRTPMAHPVVSKPELRTEAARLLGYCMEDVVDDDPDSVLSLVGVPLLPMTSPLVPLAKIAIRGGHPPPRGGA